MKEDCKSGSFFRRERREEEGLGRWEPVIFPDGVTLRRSAKPPQSAP